MTQSHPRGLSRLLWAPLFGVALLATASCGSDNGEESDAEGTQNGSASGDQITMSEVEEHDSPASCWAVIEDVVYDLTDWIDEHPGGAGRIEQLCGTDATSQFQGQHGGANAPQEQLAEMEIGELAP